MLSIVTMRPGVGFGVVHSSTQRRRYPGFGTAPNGTGSEAICEIESSQNKSRVGDDHAYQALGWSAALH